MEEGTVPPARDDSRAPAAEAAPLVVVFVGAPYPAASPTTGQGGTTCAATTTTRLVVRAAAEAEGHVAWRPATPPLFHAPYFPTPAPGAGAGGAQKKRKRRRKGSPAAPGHQQQERGHDDDDAAGGTTTTTTSNDGGEQGSSPAEQTVEQKMERALGALRPVFHACPAAPSLQATAAIADDHHHHHHEEEEEEDEGQDEARQLDDGGASAPAAKRPRMNAAAAEEEEGADDDGDKKGAPPPPPPAPPPGTAAAVPPADASDGGWQEAKALVTQDGEALLAWTALGASLQRFAGGGGGAEEDEEATPVDVWEAEAEGRAEAIMAGRVVRNDRWDREALLTALPGRTFVIPPRSAFLMSDIQHVRGPLLAAGQQQQQKEEQEEEQEARGEGEAGGEGEGEGEAEVAGGFGLVVVDPPWENRSLSRSHNYGTLAPHEIAKLPVRSLLSSAGAYVVVWVTNNPAIHNFVKRNLFPRWRVQYVATHYWLKLTSSGEPVMPLNSAHRKPYEPFIVGYHHHHAHHHAHHRHNHHEGGLPGGTPPPPPEELAGLRKEMVVCSVANRYARKPSLDDVLGLGLHTGVRRLELFARNLRPGWTSWGNQVLLFQERRHFKPMANNTGNVKAVEEEEEM